MPKAKTHKGIYKRVKITGTGKVFFKRTGARHRMIGNTNANKRRKREMQRLSKTREKTIRKMLFI